MTKQRFANVWDVIESSHEETENMKRSSAPITALKNHLARISMNQADAAALLGVTQPRVSDPMHSKINLFALDSLVNMAIKAGLQIELRISEAA